MTIHADFDEDVSVGEVNTASIGYGLHQAWIYSTMFGTSELFDVATVANGTPFSSIYLVSLVANFLALMFFGVFDGKAMTISVRRYPVVIPAAAVSIGTALVYLCDAPGPAGLALTMLSGILTGACSAVFLLYWGIAFARMTITSNIMNTVISFIVAVFVYSGLALVPAPLGGLVVIALPLLEMAFIWQHAPKPYFARRELPFFNPLPVNRGRFYLAFGLPMAFFGIALGFIRETSMTDVIATFGPDAQVVPLIIAELIAAVALVVGLAFMKSELVEDFLRPTIPLIALAMVFIPLESAFDGLLTKIAVLSGYICFESVLWIVFGAFAQRYRLSPVLVFGIGRGALGLGAFAGLAATSYLGDSGIGVMVGPYVETSIVMAALVCIAVAQSLLPRERDIRRVVLYGDVDENSVADMLNLKRGDPELDALEDRAQAAAEAGGKAAGGSAPDAGDEQAPAGEPSDEADEPAGEAACEKDGEATSDLADEPASVPGEGLAPGRAGKPTGGQADFAEGDDGSPGADADEDPDAPSGEVAAAAPMRDAVPDAARPSGDDAREGAGAFGERAASRLAPRMADDPDDVPDVPAPSRYRNPRLMPAVIMAAEESDEHEARKGYFRRKCEVVANQYLLSTRETEVLFYLAKGYNSAYLQEKLYISEGTAKTHIRHIYGKTNVHSQQELMRLVNEIWV